MRRYFVLILSKFHDYYDSVAKHGIDKTVVYKRLQDEKHLNTNYLCLETKHNFQKKEFILNEYILGFCGELYPFIQVEGGFWNSFPTLRLYKYEEAYEFLTKINLEKEQAYYRDKICLDGLKKFYEIKKLNKDYFQEYKVPVFSIKRISSRLETILLNPKLKDFEFMKIKDPYTTYQEIYMFMAGVLGTIQEKTVEISDKDKLQQHGFFKYSFKKEPWKKR